MKISVTLSREMLADIDRIAGGNPARLSSRRSCSGTYGTGLGPNGTPVISKSSIASGKLNREAEDVLQYQAPEDWYWTTPATNLGENLSCPPTELDRVC